MLPRAIQAGISQRDYWDMTLAEITIQIEADQELRENEVRAQVANAYNLAGLISLFIGNSFNGQKNPSIEELYPQLFPTSSTPGMSDAEYQRMMMYKEQFMDFAEAHNKKHQNIEEGEQ